ncbi:hypothetical protein LTR37_020029 [Vermiconidia calcicola]|uniref:Uncharacterized protein n=1 Tax=Vermiconidia calcicola TaxID=1690605 RepID=A0ACC3ME18_9PEZI|nr:hypothetical protein LTR37_020029 [Vermiconidia calcicola]
MKIILTGATGWIGSSVLARCVAHPSITSIVALTRRPLPDNDTTKAHKLHNIVHEDFLKYDERTIAQLKGAEACIWVLGSPSSGKTVHVDYTMSAVNMLLTSIVPSSPSKPFRFVYTSGGLVPYLDTSFFFFLGEARSIRANLDREILALPEKHAGRWESFVARPWFVVDSPPMSRYLLGEASWILREELAAAMVDAALRGGEERLLGDGALRRKGQEAIGREKLREYGVGEYGIKVNTGGAAC